MVTPVRRCRPDRLTRAALIFVGCLLANACSGSPTHPPVRTTVTTTGSQSAPAPASTITAAPPSVLVRMPLAAQPAVPAVVRLGWLDGASTEPGIRIKSDGFVRWQGPEPGGQALLLPGGSYRWIGVDGSTVGCVVLPSVAGGQRSCVGIDSSGDTALTRGPDSRRTVYGPDGHLIGEFDRSGARVGPGAPAQTRAAAIAASGVDLPELVDFATSAQPFAGGVTGDPHLITAGGIRVSTQQAGDFEARAGDRASQIQIRTEMMPYQTDVSYVTAVAVAVPGHRIEFTLNGTVSIDGAPIASAGSFLQVPVGDGLQIGRWPPDGGGVVDATLLWPDGSTVSVAADPSLGLTVITRAPHRPAAGLFGDTTAPVHDVPAPATTTHNPQIPDADAPGPEGDFLARSGSVAASSEAVVGSWRVPAADSLLSGSVPRAEPSAGSAQISPTATRAAQRACAAAGLANLQDVFACVFDVARTGDDGYVFRDAELAMAAAPSPLPAVLASTWPGLVLGTAVSALPLSLGAQLDTTVPAGDRRLYRINLERPTTVSITAAACPHPHESGTPEHPDGDEAAEGAAALRLFDVQGNAVSGRRTDCGSWHTGQLAGGTYYLVLAGPTAGAGARFELRVG